MPTLLRNCRIAGRVSLALKIAELERFGPPGGLKRVVEIETCRARGEAARFDASVEDLMVIGEILTPLAANPAESPISASSRAGGGRGRGCQRWRRGMLWD